MPNELKKILIDIIAMYENDNITIEEFYSKVVSAVLDAE